MKTAPHEQRRAPLDTGRSVPAQWEEWRNTSLLMSASSHCDGCNEERDSTEDQRGAQDSNPPPAHRALGVWARRTNRRTYVAALHACWCTVA